MITSISLENFKGIGERVTVPLKPITLLFGPNSGGKSTIIHALHYVREILDRSNVDASLTLSGGEFVDLGGFRNFVHNRELDRPVRIRIDFQISKERGLPEYVEDEADRPTVGNRARDAWVELETRWSLLLGKAYVARYSVGINGAELGTIEYDPGRRSIQLTGINPRHPVFDWPKSYDENPNSEVHDRMLRTSFYGQADDRHKNLWESLASPFESLPEHFDLLRQTSALPKWKKPLIWAWSPPEEDRDAKIDAMVDLSAVLSQLIVGPGELLKEYLDEFRYIGPMRAVPPRDFRPQPYPNVQRWPNGLAAWDALAGAQPELLEAVSSWLSSPDRLATGYKVVQHRQKVIDKGSELWVGIESGRIFDDYDSAEFRAAIQGLQENVSVKLVDVRPEVYDARHSPADVGFGISQVVPVVVALLVGKAKGQLIAIEQPELHVHPRIQTALGDLLIDWVHRNRSTGDKESVPFRSGFCLIETHSEHMLLRLLRRIRETNEGKLVDRTDHQLTPEDISVFYIEPLDEGVRIQELRVDESGEFLDKWPQGFFEERGEELFG